MTAIPNRRLSSAALSFAIAVGAGCMGSVRLAHGDLDRLRQGPEIPVVYEPSPGPWVNCPTGEGESVWGGPSGALEPPPSAIILAGTLWEDFQAQRTAGLMVPPVDPARATAEEFAAAARNAPRPVPFRDHAERIENTEGAALARRFGTVPVLVFRTYRFVLVGCWYTYTPWYDVRATLLQAGSGKVLWRDTCGESFPPGRPAEYSPAELEANGDALYGRVIEDRAQGCARELFGSFDRAAAPAAREPAPRRG